MSSSPTLRALWLPGVLALVTACPDSITHFPKTDAGLVCGAGTLQCGNACVNLSVDDANCGVCGTACAATDRCAGGSCYPKNCTGFECGDDQVCVNSSFCQQAVCVGTNCGAGQTCSGGACVPQNCETSPCAPGNICSNNTCKDLRCDGVTCHSGDVCVAGACYPASCPNTPCGADQVCLNGTTCTQTACVPVTCQADQTCVAGACLPESCNGTACQHGETCQGGACTDVVCQSITCPSGQACHRGACEASTATCDGGVTSDPNNCGACGTVCPTPAHAPAACSAGVCGRGVCASGFFDVDGPATPGCESTCTGTVCTLPDGGSVTLTSPPNEQAAGVLNSGASVGVSAQTNGQYRHLGMVGESPGGGQPAASDGTHQHSGGFNGIAK